MCENNTSAISGITLKVLRDLGLLDPEDFPRSVCNNFSI